jgi:hypothetical protein
MNIDYIYNLEHADGICDSFKNSITTVFFNKGSATTSITHNYCETKTYQRYFRPIKRCIELCRILKPKSIAADEDYLYEVTSNLEDSNKVRDIEGFNLTINVLKTTLALARQEMWLFFSSFDDEERERINEAIHTYFENCNYSCIAMSVSAVESRLLKLMSITNPDAIPTLEDMTLGQLITEYIQNKEAYKNVVPKKHKALLELCNTYRIFSVHPKKEAISAGIASSILNLSLVFLADENTVPATVKSKLSAT